MHLTIINVKSLHIQSKILIFAKNSVTNLLKMIIYEQN